jgi:hypothetical protein
MTAIMAIVETATVVAATAMMLTLLPPAMMSIMSMAAIQGR